MDACLPERSGIAKDILLYLAAHPDARDTLEGIGRSWLTGRDAAPALLKDVLADLVTQGLVDMQREKNGSTLYSSHKKPRNA